MTFAFYTLGCKVNQYETQAMEQLLTQWGHQVQPWDTPCDGYIVNTCSVTAVADRKNRTVIRRLQKEHPQAVIGVCGCYSQHDAPAVQALGVTVVGGSAQREAFLRDMVAAVEDRLCRVQVDQALKRRVFEPLPAGGLAERTRAMLKIQDGCVNFCTYCIIPYTRGPVRSAPEETVMSQALALAQRGYREIVLTGIEIASWGVDLPGKPPLADLIYRLCQALPQVRIRLGSLEPRIITPEFCKLLSSCANLCPHFHLSLQSGSDTVLSRMHRKYDTARYLESVALLNAHFPGCAITTDMIVGFPGETEEEFAQSLAFIPACGFADMHIFPYSRRPGTPADKMPDQLPNATKEDRSRRAIAVAQQVRRQWIQAQLGTTREILFEEEQDGYCVGHTPNYLKVYHKAPALHNQLRTLTLTEVFRDGVLAEV